MIVTTFRGAVIKVEVANFCAAMDTLIDQDEGLLVEVVPLFSGQPHSLDGLLTLILTAVNSHLWLQEVACAQRRPHPKNLKLAHVLN